MDGHSALFEPERLPAVLFEAVITPHRSLTRRGLTMLLGAIGAGSLMTTAVLLYLGAWPVVGFNGLEVALAAAMITSNARRRRECEEVRLTGTALEVIRTDRQGRRRTRVLDASWMNVSLEEHPARVPVLWVGSRRAREEIGRLLGEAEKRDLARALAAALHRQRHPEFDNPQLRA